MPDSVKELFESMADRFDPNAWGSDDAVLVFDVTGQQAGKWIATIEGGSLTINEGSVDSADMTMSCSDETLLAMVDGTLNPVSAFMQGMVKIDGNMSLAMKLQGLLNA